MFVWSIQHPEVQMTPLVKGQSAVRPHQVWIINRTSTLPQSSHRILVSSLSPLCSVNNLSVLLFIETCMAVYVSKSIAVVVLSLTFPASEVFMAYGQGE